VTLLLQQFDHLITTPESVKVLEDLILQLAFEGKLVEQDPNDVPAKHILDQMKEDKDYLIEQNLIPKQTKAVPINNREKPFRLPKGWEWARLKDLCHDWGQRKPKKKFTYIDVSSINNLKGLVLQRKVG
jgi:type I restriction enzyme, S subunit